MKDCPHCQGSGLTRLDWIKVPIWQACSCASTAALGLPITWNWMKESNPSVATPGLPIGVVVPV